ncbi:MAG: GGDEF domain-containing protein [Armatimonadetes bacterium]|nr:GGDEF domain-containing protein [Armatimonadota bacterium]
MGTVRDIMAGDGVSLGPENKVKTAILLMKNHNVSGLPVIEGERIVGVVEHMNLLGKDNDIPIEHVMDREFVTIPPELSVSNAADLMAKTAAERLLVVQDGRLIGVVTAAMLLPELGKSLDELTRLPRADAMRDWGIAALKGGSEITVIFVDLDRFGHFNKQYGHIVGDKVLKHVADVLLANTDEDTDMLCRYAGDEFAIVTLRNRDDARELAALLDGKLRNAVNHELPEPVTASFGIFGGKRTKEREDMHYAATLDNLINLASKACTENKPGAAATATQAARAAERPAAAAIEPASEHDKPTVGTRLEIRSLNFSWESGSIARVEVHLAHGDVTESQVSGGFALGNNALRLVGEAVAGAIHKFLPEGYGIVVDSVHPINSGLGDEVVLVEAVLVTPQTEIRLTGSAIVRQDRYRTTAAALLDAVNRQLSGII